MKTIKRMFLPSLLCLLLTTLAWADSGGVDVGNGRVVNIPGTDLEIKVPGHWVIGGHDGQVVIEGPKGGRVVARAERLSGVGDVTLEQLEQHARLMHPSANFKMVKRDDIVGVESETVDQDKSEIVTYLMGSDKRPIELTSALPSQELEEGKKIITSVRMRYRGVPTATNSIDVPVSMLHCEREHGDVPNPDNCKDNGRIGAFKIRPGLCLPSVALNTGVATLFIDHCAGPLLRLDQAGYKGEMLTVVRQSPEVGKVIRISNDPADYDKIRINGEFLELPGGVSTDNMYEFSSMRSPWPIGFETIGGNGTYLVRAAAWPSFDFLFRVRIQNDILTIGPLAQVPVEELKVYVQKLNEQTRTGIERDAGEVILHSMWTSEDNFSDRYNFRFNTSENPHISGNVWDIAFTVPWPDGMISVYGAEGWITPGDGLDALSCSMISNVNERLAGTAFEDIKAGQLSDLVPNYANCFPKARIQQGDLIYVQVNRSYTYPLNYPAPAKNERAVVLKIEDVGPNYSWVRFQWRRLVE